MEIELGERQCLRPASPNSPPWEERVTFYNCDIPLPQVYLYEKGLFPTGRCVVECENNRIFKIRADPSESVWLDDGVLPDLRVMELRTDGSTRSYWQGSGGALVLECEGYRLDMEDMDLEEIQRFLNRLILT